MSDNVLGPPGVPGLVHLRELVSLGVAPREKPQPARYEIPSDQHHLYSGQNDSSSLPKRRIAELKEAMSSGQLTAGIFLTLLPILHLRINKTFAFSIYACYQISAATVLDDESGTHMYIHEQQALIMVP